MSRTPDIDADKVADLLLILETAPALGFRLAATSIIETTSFGGASRCAVVQVRLGERCFNLTPAESRMVARCIGFEDQRRATGWLASLFESAAGDTEATAEAPGGQQRLRGAA